MKLIKLKTDHYVVVDDSDIKEGDWCEDNGTIYNIKDKKHLLTVLNFGSPVKITHSNIGHLYQDSILPLSLQEVKELLGVVDVEKKAEKFIGCKYEDIEDSIDQIGYDSFIRGYNQALEDNKEKKYTEEDLKRYHNIMCLHGNKKGEEFIQSLQPKTEWGVEFIDGKLTLKNYERK